MIDDEICLQRLHEADYPRNWGPLEAGAVDGFFLALLRGQLATAFDIDAMGYTGYGDDKVEVVLCMAAFAGADLAPLLAAWDQDKGRIATLHLANVVVIADWRLRQLHDTWWLHREPAEQAMQQVVQWLLRWETWERLEQACLDEPEEGAATLLSHAEGVIAGAHLVRPDQSSR